MSALDAVATEARALYDTYLATVVPLFAGESTDLDPLVALFAVPTTAVLPDACLVLPDQAALVRFFTAQIDQLRRAGYASTTVHRLEVRSLNARAAWIEGVFTRYTREGRELARFGTVYLVVKPADRWQFSALIMTAA
jgi:hypothetical protein